MQQIKCLADQRYLRPQAATRNLHPQDVLIMWMYMDPNRLTCKASALVVLQDICVCYGFVLIEANTTILGCFLSETHSPQYMSPLYSL